MIGACNRTIFFIPPPWDPGEGQISSNIIKFQLQSQFQRFLNQTLRSGVLLFASMNKFSLKYMWIYAADVKNRQHFQDKTRQQSGGQPNPLSQNHMTLKCDLESWLRVCIAESWVLHINSLRGTFEWSLLKIVERVQVTWSRHEIQG